MIIDNIRCRLSFILSIFFCALFFSGNCSRGKNHASSDAILNGGLFNLYREFDPSSLLSNLSKNVILKTYIELEKNAKDFKSATDTYTQNCNNTSSLQNLQTLWKANISTLKSIEITQFGPATQGGYYEIMDPWVNSFLSNPADTYAINTYIDGTETIDSSKISQLSKFQRGLPAIEYLLFNDGDGNSSASSICTNLMNRRLLFMTVLVSDYYDNANALKNAWIETSGNFVNELSTAGNGSKFFETKKYALDTLINQMVGVLDTVIDKKLGYPTGLNVSSNGIVRADYAESRYADFSVVNLVNNLKSIQNYHLGNGGSGISEYVNYLNPILDRKIVVQIDDAISKTNMISSLRTSLMNSDSATIRDSYNSIRTLRITLTNELILSSSKNVTSSGNTGDGD